MEIATCVTLRVCSARAQKERTAPAARHHGDAPAPALQTRTSVSCIYLEPPPLPLPPQTCRFFDEGRCGLRCQRGRFAVGNQCSFCHHTCQECTDDGPDNCTSCDTGNHGIKVRSTETFLIPLSTFGSLFHSDS